jgi:hypothetical protein
MVRFFARKRETPSRTLALQAWILGAVSHSTPGLRAAIEAAYAALDAGDIEAFLERVDEDVEFTSIVAEAEGTTFRGHQGVREWQAKRLREGYKATWWAFFRSESEALEAVGLGS